MSTLVIILYGLLPIIFAVGSLAGSTLVSWKARSFAHYCLSGIIFAAAFSSLLMLYDIFYLDARASYLPHYVILSAFVIFAAQAFYVLRHKNAA